VKLIKKSAVILTIAITSITLLKIGTNSILDYIISSDTLLTSLSIIIGFSITGAGIVLSSISSLYNLLITTEKLDKRIINKILNHFSNISREMKENITILFFCFIYFICSLFVLRINFIVNNQTLTLIIIYFILFSVQLSFIVLYDLIKGIFIIQEIYSEIIKETINNRNLK